MKMYALRDNSTGLYYSNQYPSSENWGDKPQLFKTKGGIVFSLNAHSTFWSQYRQDHQTPMGGTMMEQHEAWKVWYKGFHAAYRKIKDKMSLFPKEWEIIEVEIDL